MDIRRPAFFGLFLLTLTLCGSTAIVGIAPARADDVTEWNAIAIDVLALAGQNPVVMTRGLAMAHLAVHDALNAIDRRYEPYLYSGGPSPAPRPVPRWPRPCARFSSGHSRGSAPPSSRPRGKSGRTPPTRPRS